MYPPRRSGRGEGIRSVHLSAPNDQCFARVTPNHILIWQEPEPEPTAADHAQWCEDDRWLGSLLDEYGIRHLPPPQLDEGFIRWDVNR